MLDDLAGEAVDPREIALLYRRLARGELTAAHLDWRLVPAEERLQERRLLSAAAAAGHGGRRGGGPAACRRSRAPAGCASRSSVAATSALENARAVAGAANAELALLHDAAPALAEAAAARAGGDVVDTLDAALDADRVDAVFLSVPHDLHAPLAVRAAEAGLHVVVEKPLAVDLDSAARGGRGGRARPASSSRSASRTATSRAPPPHGRSCEAGAIGPLRGAALVFHADKPAVVLAGRLLGPRDVAAGARPSRGPAAAC